MWRGLFIQAAYTVSSYGWVGWGGIRDHDWDADTAGFAYARPVLTLRKNDNSELWSSTLSVEFSSSTSLGW